MPGAVNVPFTELVEDGRLKSADQLQEVFAAKGVKGEAHYDELRFSRLTAAVITLGLEIAGAHDVSLYDGSWTEYAPRRAR